MTDSFRHGKRPITLWLEEYEDQKFHPYFCPDCGKIMFKYKGQVVSEVPGNPPVKQLDTWIEMKCDNRECGRVAYIKGFCKRQLEYKIGYR